jgi:hypothetical protein
MIGFTGTLLPLQSIMTAHNQWLSKTRCIRYWTTSVFSSAMTDLDLIYESATSSASVVRWLALHSWTLNLWILLRLTNPDHEWILFQNSGRTEERPPLRRVRLLLFASFVATKCVSISGQRFDFYQHIRCNETRFNEPLSRNGLFRHKF